jgi:hypothetical protein
MSSSSQVTHREPVRDAAFRQLIEQLDALAETARRLAAVCRDELADQAPTLDRDQTRPGHTPAAAPPLADWLLTNYRLVVGALVTLGILVVAFGIAVL